MDNSSWTFRGQRRSALRIQEDRRDRLKQVASAANGSTKHRTKTGKLKITLPTLNFKK